MYSALTSAQALPAANPAPSTIFVQLSDPHIREPGRLAYGRLETAPYLRAAVAAVNALPQAPEAVVLTGDLTDFGRAEEYAHLAALIAPLTSPVYLLPGNHDTREGLRAAFPGHAYLAGEGTIHYAVDIGGLRLLALDTSVPGHSHGELDDAQLEWLDQELVRCVGRPAVIAMHHPPFATMIGHMDKIGLLAGARELESIVARHPHVERIICGHVHRPVERRFGGTIVSICPSPAHQVCLDLQPEAESAWVLEPPAFRVHAMDPDGRLVSHLKPIGQFDGPHPFHDNGKLID
ncbi:phosphodiesterase [Bordetella sp. N]|uniref:phosphodiesterase n=1 Tax=Bordetella sp. N TaxID=1746199 RepID=UPI0007109BDB|nr:metallophosphatase [Bordetella sp. N]